LFVEVRADARPQAERTYAFGQRRNCEIADLLAELLRYHRYLNSRFWAVAS